MIRTTVLAIFLAAALSSTVRGREIAVTIDDLPVVSTRRDIETRREITRLILRHLAKSAIPAVGFVNEGKLYDGGKLDDAQTALLRMWVDAGYELGNHTFSHMSLHDNPLDAYKADILKGETVTRGLVAAKGAKIRYFRHPYLWTGLTIDIKRDLGTFLAEHGYIIAPVTVDNADWIFARAYDNAFDKGDRKMMRSIGAAYVPYLESKLDYFERQSVRTFGREISQVLLLHANRINGDYLGKLAKAMRKRQYRFVTLEEALRDAAYQNPDTYTKRNGISWLHRWALDKGKEALVPDEPKVPEFVLKYSGFDSE